MCIPASFVLTKGRVFWSKTSDSHEDIIAEHGLAADGVRGPNVVRVEIAPPHFRLDLPLDVWLFKVDQDALPDWWDAVEGESLVRRELVEWRKTKVFTEGHIVVDGRAAAYLYGRASATMHDSASAELYDSASATLYDSASARLHGRASATMHDSASATLHDSASARLHGRASATLHDSARARLYDRSVAIKTGGNPRISLVSGSQSAVVDWRAGRTTCRVARLAAKRG